MKVHKFVGIVLLLSLSAFSQESKDRLNEFLVCFQENLAEGLDLSSFDTIPDTTLKKIKIDAFVNLCLAKGTTAQRKATSIIEAKVKKNPLSDDEVLIIIYDSYKSEIPKLKNSYLDYVQSKMNVTEKKINNDTCDVKQKNLTL